MTGTMSWQVDKLKVAELHVDGFVCEINRNGLVDGFRKTIDAEELFTRLFGEARLSQERGETAADQRQSRLVVRHCLRIQFMHANPGIRQRAQLGKSAKVIDVPMRQKDVG